MIDDARKVQKVWNELIEVCGKISPWQVRVTKPSGICITLDCTAQMELTTPYMPEV